MLHRLRYNYWLWLSGQSVGPLFTLNFRVQRYAPISWVWVQTRFVYCIIFKMMLLSRRQGNFLYYPM